MLTGVIITNLIIALLCLYVAKRLRMLTRTLLEVERRLNLIEHNTHNVLNPAPEFISRGEMGTLMLRQRYQKLQQQWQKLQQLLAIVTLGKSIMKFSHNRSRLRL